MKKQKIKLGKVKRKETKKFLTDSELSTLISAITQEYSNRKFQDIKDELHEKYAEAFKYSNYTYKGFKTDLGTIQDIDIFFEKKSKN